MSDFSIDFILNRAGQQYFGTNGSLGINLNRNVRTAPPPVPIFAVRGNYEPNEQDFMNAMPSKSLQTNMDTDFGQSPMFDWLQYTRYHPPKLPRTFRACPTKRTPGRLPRIPFSPAQLHTLEDAYKNSNYLSAEEANRLAEILELTNTRVKIWFQNRRARERRERREKDESCESTLSSNASSPEPEDLVVVI